MICARHDWWEAETQCPTCNSSAAGATVTAAETLRADDDGMAIPGFLKRAPDGSLLHPRTRLDNYIRDERAPNPERPRVPVSLWSDADLRAAVDSTELTLVERQPIYQELRHREDKKKSLARIAEMKQKKAAKETAS